MASILRVDTIQTTTGTPYITNGVSLSATTTTHLAGGAAGSIPYQTGSGATTFLSAGSNSQILLGGTTPSWTNISGLSVSSAAQLTTSRTINGISFNGTANIEVNPSSGNYSNGYGARYISTSNPSGGNDGDIWYKY